MDQQYVDMRNTLIPIAERYANKAAGQSGTGKSMKEREVWAARWNRAFHRRMNALYGTQQFVPCPTCKGKGFIKEENNEKKQ